MQEILYSGKRVLCEEGETVLAALLRHGLDLPYSCRKGTCLTCMVRAVDGTVPEAARRNLKTTEIERGLFLACQCVPVAPLALMPVRDAENFGRATIRDVTRLASDVCRVVIRPATALYYRAGQFINLRRRDGLMRSYSIASVPRLDRDIEMHVKRLPGGEMSGWLFEQAEHGDEVGFQGPNGNCFYIPGRSDQPLLLIGTGTGVAPLVGLARDALHAGHAGPIHLYHGSRRVEGLYFNGALHALSGRHPSLHYHACVSGEAAPTGFRSGRADEAAFSDLPDLAGWRVYLCGYPVMVRTAQKRAYLAGAALSEIMADPFDLRDKRATPRRNAVERADVW